MAFAFGPNGFDDDKKRRAEEAEEMLEAATAFMGFAAAGATVVLPPLAVGLGIAAAAGPLLAVSLRRIKRDPPRADFYAATEVPRTAIDMSVVLDERVDPYNYPNLISGLSSYVVALERAGCHTGAMVTAVERAMGAYHAHVGAAVELRVAEARLHARHALGAAATLVCSARPIQDFIEQHWPSPTDLLNHVDPSLTFEEHLADAAAAGRLAATGVADGFLSSRPLQVDEPERIAPESLSLAASSVYDTLRGIVSELPPSVDEFIAQGEDAGAYA